MKKIIATCFMVLFLFVSTASAAPFLVADAQPLSVLGYNLNVDGIDYTLPPTAVDASTVRIVYDLQGIAVGAHTTTLRARTIWGLSDPVPFGFSRDVPPVPTNIRLEP